MPKPIRLKHICRIDNESTRTRAWRVTIQRRHEVTIKHFSDALHGGKNKALAAAKAFRDSLFQKVDTVDSVVWRRQQKRGNNTSGIVGVARYIARETHNGRTVERPFWQAFWSDREGQRLSRKFMVSVHGERKARQLAIQRRLDGTRTAVEEAISQRRAGKK